MITFLGGSSVNNFHELLVFIWNLTRFQHGTSSNKFWFLEVMPVNCLKHFPQTDILDWLLYFKVMWCRFWWYNISATRLQLVVIPLLMQFIGPAIPTQPSFIGTWATTFTMYDSCWLQCLHTVSTNQETNLDIISLHNLIWYWSYVFIPWF